MKVLVLNAGSTSIKYKLYEMDTERVLAAGGVERVGSPEAVHRDAAGAEAVEARSVDEALAVVVERLVGKGAAGGLEDIAAVGHRVVHGGEKLTKATAITDDVKEAIRAASVFAPLHNPRNLAGIDAALRVLPKAKQVAVFDTAFHAEMEPDAFSYALPYDLYVKGGVRRYGFHGPSHQYMAQSASEFLKTDISRLKLVTCHLGGGASVAAIDGGRSIDSSMGMTPLEGLAMGTRSGDLDPGVVLHLLRGGMSVDEVDELLNRRSGLLGLSGVSDDYRDVERAADQGSETARLAIAVFTRRIKKYVGAYAALLGGADAVVFTGGIGENSARVRSAVCEGLVYMGVDVDPIKNAAHAPGDSRVRDVATDRAPCRVLVLKTDEERMIAREVVRAIAGPTAARTRVSGGGPIPVGVSVRHVHLSREDCDALFGPGYELTERRPVTQPGQYVCRETVDLVGPKGTIERVAIINPLRKETQVELAKTDAIALGVSPPLRESGKLDGTPGVRVRGPAGAVDLQKGVILAHRHVHMHPEDAARLGVSDKAMIRVRVPGDREVVFGDVIVRVSEQFSLDMHVDTDEANAAGLTSDSVVDFDGVQERP